MYSPVLLKIESRSPLKQRHLNTIKLIISPPNPKPSQGCSSSQRTIAPHTPLPTSETWGPVLSHIRCPQYSLSPLGGSTPCESVSPSAFPFHLPSPCGFSSLLFPLKVSAQVVLFIKVMATCLRLLSPWRDELIQVWIFHVYRGSSPVTLKTSTPSPIEPWLPTLESWFRGSLTVGKAACGGRTPKVWVLWMARGKSVATPAPLW